MNARLTTATRERLPALEVEIIVVGRGRLVSAPFDHDDGGCCGESLR